MQNLSNAKWTNEHIQNYVIVFIWIFFQFYIEKFYFSKFLS